MENGALRQLLAVCDNYLSRGDYTNCRDFAVKAQVCYPNDPGPVQILTICAVLAAASSSGSSTTRPDWYSILHLPRHTSDLSSIERNFNQLSNLLNPTKNPYSLAATAHQWVTKAWTVLSEPSLKSMVDKDLKMEENLETNSETFWTRCPKCIYMYEYENKFNGCLLRCQNVKCMGVYTAEMIPVAAAPPPDLVNGDVYVCYGFSPLGHGGPQEWNSWWPFVSAVSELVKNSKGNIGKEEKDGVESEVKDEGISGINFNCEEKKTVDDVEKQSNGGKTARKKRTKTMARATSKVMGKGIKVSLDEIFSKEGTDDEEGANRNEEKRVLDDVLGLDFKNLMDGVDDFLASLDRMFGPRNDNNGSL